MLDYLKEIKNRLIFVFIAGFSCCVIVYTYKEILLFLMIKIFQNSFFEIPNFNFISTSITEIFLVYISLIKFIAIQIVSAFTTYHFFVFFASALYKVEYKYCKNIFLSIFKAWFVALFCTNYFLVPLSWEFFYSFQMAQLYDFIDFYFEAKISEYLIFYKTIYYACALYIISFAIVVTTFSFINNKIFLIKKYRKIYYYIFFVFCTLISPPDIFSQLFILLLILFFFEGFILSLTLKLFVNFKMLAS